MTHRFTLAAAATVAVGAVAAVTAPVHAAVGSNGLAAVRAANKTATGQAGYFAAHATTSQASATFKVPAVKGCTSTLTGDAPGAFIFTGTSSAPSLTVSAVFVGCQNGVPFYEGVAVINGSTAITDTSISAGDTISVAATESASASSVTFKDVTKKFAKTVKGGGAATIDSVFLGVDSLVNSQTNAQLPNANFGVIKFSGAKENNTTPKAAAAVAYNMATTGGTLQILTGALNSTGNGWTETYKHA